MQAHIAENKKKNTVNEFVIDDGKKEVPVKNKFGEVIAVLRFRTTDVNIIKRAEQARKDISKTIKSLKNVEIKSDGTAKYNEDIKLLEQAEKEVKELINGIFNDDVCSDLFKVCNPFSPIGGDRPFVYNVVEVLMNILDREFSQQQEEHIRKYTDDLQ